MRRSALDLGVGLFVLLGLVALAWMSVKLGRVDLLGNRGYVVSADFPTVGGLKTGSTIEIAGSRYSMPRVAKKSTSFVNAAFMTSGAPATM